MPWVLADVQGQIQMHKIMLNVMSSKTKRSYCVNNRYLSPTTRLCFGSTRSSLLADKQYEGQRVGLDTSEGEY